MSEVCGVAEPEVKQNKGRTASEGKSQHFGELLAARRQALKLSQGDMAERLRLHPRQIAALESADLSALPEFAFVRGYVRNYARALDLEEAPLLNSLLQVASPNDDDSDDKSADEVRAEIASPSMSSTFVESQLVSTEPQTERSAGGQGLKYGLGALLGAIVVVGGIYGYFSTRSETVVPAVKPSARTDTQVLQDWAAASGAAGEQPDVQLAAEGEATDGAADTQTQTGADAESAKTESDDSAQGTEQESVAASAKEPLGPPVLEVSFRKRTWYDLVQGDGRQIASRVVSSGYRREFSGHPPYRLRVTTGSAVSVRWRGQTVLLGEPTGNDAYVTVTLE